MSTHLKFLVELDIAEMGPRPSQLEEKIHNLLTNDESVEIGIRNVSVKEITE